MSAKPGKDSNREDKAATSENSSAPGRLPFEPGQTRKKAAKKAASTPATKASEEPAKKLAPSSAKQSGAKQSGAKPSSVKPSATIPAEINRRMVRRMAVFCGVPTFLGMLTLVLSYVAIINHWFKLPHTAVLLVNLGFFGLAVLGLSYGALSASWDEGRPGSWLGWQEFTTNFGRLTASWRSAKEKPDS